MRIGFGACSSELSRYFLQTRESFLSGKNNELRTSRNSKYRICEPSGSNDHNENDMLIDEEEKAGDIKFPLVLTLQNMIYILVDRFTSL